MANLRFCGKYVSNLPHIKPDWFPVLTTSFGQMPFDGREEGNGTQIHGCESIISTTEPRLFLMIAGPLWVLPLTAYIRNIQDRNICTITNSNYWFYRKYYKLPSTHSHAYVQYELSSAINSLRKNVRTCYVTCATRNCSQKTINTTHRTHD